LPVATMIFCALASAVRLSLIRICSAAAGWCAA